MTRDLDGKTYVVTGANAGIGAVTASVLARRGGHVVMACRSEDKTRPVLERIQQESGKDSARFVMLDLSSLESVRGCALKVLQMNVPIHALINNAGFAGVAGVTREGFELGFGVNHLGHFLLTNILLERIKRSGPARIVNVASKAHERVTGIDWDAQRQPTKSFKGLREYGVSKLCNVLHARELAKRLTGTGVTTYSLHPGVVASDAWRQMPWPIRPVIKRFMLTPEQGAATTLKCATFPPWAAHSGRYYDTGSEKQPNAAALDDNLAAQLWNRSDEWTRDWMPR